MISVAATLVAPDGAPINTLCTSNWNATVAIANLGTNDGMSIERAPAEYKAKAQGLLGEKFTVIMDDMQRTMAITAAVKDAAAV